VLANLWPKRTWLASFALDDVGFLTSRRHDDQGLGIVGGLLWLYCGRVELWEEEFAVVTRSLEGEGDDGGQADGGKVYFLGGWKCFTTTTV
jgi:hypothetical protein